MSEPAQQNGSPGASAEWVDWIEETGRVLGVVSRAEMRRRNLLHPVTATFVFRPDGELFVQRRAASKDVYPGLSDLSVGGTVAHGEAFAHNAYREVAEELGVEGVPLFNLFRHRFQDDLTNSLIEVFACVYPGPIRLQAEEVSGGDWCSPSEAQGIAESEICCPDSRQAWRLYREQVRAEGPLSERIESGALLPVPHPETGAS